MRALVTGGGGFIGSNVARLLLHGGWEVVILDNFSTGFRENVARLRPAAVLEADVRDAEAVGRAMRGVQVVFHLAASVGNARSIAHPIDDAEINVLGTLRVLEAVRAAGARLVVFSSSAGIFGELRHLPIREDHPVEPDSPYGATKLAAEKLCLAYAKLYDLDAICLRYFNVYGINQRYDAYGNVIPIFAHRLLHGMPLVVFGDGHQTRDFVNVRDVAQANLMASRTCGVSGAFNIGSGTSITINALAELMCTVSGLRSQIEHGPLRRGDVHHSLADITAARTVLHYEPTVPMDEGLAEYLDWARSEMI